MPEEQANLQSPLPSDQVVVRPARTSDVTTIRRFIDFYSNDRILLSKATVALYEDVQEFVVAEVVLDNGDSQVVGCGALHVIWQDLAEVRTIATDPEFSGRGIGSAILTRLLEMAEAVGVERVFVLTFEIDFFASFGFNELEGTPVEPHVYEEILKSYDEGVAEFLDLEHVKPNTLGNTRMLKLL